jgi:hypothetical protein
MGVSSRTGTQKEVQTRCVSRCGKPFVQAVRAFWVELQKAFQAMGYKRSESDPCMYIRGGENGNICMWLTWIDACIAIGKKSVVECKRAQLMSLFDCDDVGLMMEYIGNKIEIGDWMMKMMQPVLLKSLVDEFEKAKLAN